MHDLTVLDNGLEVVTERADSARSVTVGTFVRTGSRKEREGEFGVSHFLEHMMFKGTRISVRPPSILPKLSRVWEVCSMPRPERR